MEKENEIGQSEVRKIGFTSNQTLLDSSSNSLIHRRKKQCGLLLKRNVTIWNAITIYFIAYLISLSFMTGGNLFTILIQDKKYYVISEQELGTVQGSFNTYLTVSMIPVQLVSGILIDKCGRKGPLSLLSFLIAAMLAILPYGGHIYPGLFIIKFVLNASLEVLASSPLLADYVHHSTKGLAGGYMQISFGLQTTIFSFVFLQLAESIDLAYICWMAGAIALAIAIYCSVFIINVYSRDTR